MRITRALALCALLLAVGHATLDAADLDRDTAQHFAQLALDCVHREYPNKIAHVLSGDEDVLPPRELTPAFYGCYDWHSAVHGHWLLARLARTAPGAEFSQAARDALDQSIQAEKIATEARYLEGPGRVSFERPYGLAWLLQLAAELREWQEDPQAQWWAFNLGPLELVLIATAGLHDHFPDGEPDVRRATGQLESHTRAQHDFDFVVARDDELVQVTEANARGGRR